MCRGEKVNVSIRVIAWFRKCECACVPCKLKLIFCEDVNYAIRFQREERKKYRKCGDRKKKHSSEHEERETVSLKKLVPAKKGIFKQGPRRFVSTSSTKKQPTSISFFAPAIKYLINIFTRP